MRLRAIIDDHGEQGDSRQRRDDFCHARSPRPAPRSKRMHLARQQHNKVLVVPAQRRRREGLGWVHELLVAGLYIQANNALVFQDTATVALFGRAFDAYWALPKTKSAGKFRDDPLSQQWWETRNVADSRFRVSFSPHTDIALSLGPVARAIENAESSVLYAVVFLNQFDWPGAGVVRGAGTTVALLVRRGAADKRSHRAQTRRVARASPFRVHRRRMYLSPSRGSGHGNTNEFSNMVHHKFVVTDFNAAQPRPSSPGHPTWRRRRERNGDHLIWIEDRKIADRRTRSKRYGCSITSISGFG